MGLGLDHETEWDVCRGKGTFGQRGLSGLGLGLEEGAGRAEHLCAHSHLHLLAHKLKLSVSVGEGMNVLKVREVCWVRQAGVGES